MVEKLDVFISSAQEEFEKERIILSTKISINQFLRCKLLEQTGASPTSVEKASVSGVSKCDIYVGIFGENYSKTTESEYDEAVRCSKPIFIYIKKVAKRDGKLFDLINIKIKPDFKMHEFKSNKNLYTTVIDNLEVFIGELLKMGLEKFKDNKNRAITSEEDAKEEVSQIIYGGLTHPPAKLMEAAQQSLTQKDYLSAIVKSSIAFETWLRSKIDENKLTSDPRIPLYSLVKKAMEIELLNKDEINTIRELRVLRNNAIHKGESPTEKSTKQILHNVAHVMQTHDLFSTKGEEETITRNFLCILYYMSRNDSQIEKQGLNSTEIYAKLELKAIHDENLINLRIKKIVQNNVHRGYIIVVASTERVKITQKGNDYCYSNCRGAPTP